MEHSTLGNWTYLQTRGILLKKELAEGKNGIPPAWFLFFGPDSLRIGPEGVALSSPLDEATARAHRRRALLAPFLPNDAAQILERFVARVAEKSRRVVEIDPAELRAMLEPEDLNDWLREAVESLEHPTAKNLSAVFSDYGGLEIVSGRLTWPEGVDLENALLGAMR